MRDAYGIFSEHKILLVEDMTFFQEIVKKMLEMTLVKVECAADGFEAVSMFDQAADEYSLILMNIEMPDMDGYEATRQIRELDHHPNSQTIPIIAFTGHRYDDVIDKCLAAGMNAHIGRPISDVDLIEVLRKYLLPEQSSEQ
jgi:CheY-like chemotaxis protein